MPDKFELKDIDLDEVSTVDAGMNQHAKILLFKRGAFKTEFGRQFPMGDYAYVPDPTKPSTWKLRLTADPGKGANVRIVGAAVAALGPTGFRGRKVQIPAKDLPKVKAKVLAAWKQLHPDAKELPASLTKMSTAEESAVFKLYVFGNDGGNDMTPEELAKRLEEMEADIAKANADNAILQKRADDAEAALAVAKAEHDALVEKAKKGENPFKPADADAATEEEEMKKRAALPESVRKKMDEQDAEIKKQAETIAKMQEDTAVKEYIAKAKASYPNLPCTPEELGQALRDVSKSAPGSLDVIEKVLAAGEEAITKSMDEFGLGGEGDSNTALASLEKLAGEITKRDGITKEQAFVKAKNENPELWKRHRAELKGAH